MTNLCPSDSAVLVFLLVYYSRMKPEQRDSVLLYIFEKILGSKYANKTFYRFVFSFIAVIAGVLFFILVLGVGSEV